MDIKVNYGTDSDGLDRQSMYINGEDVLWVSALSECPEDAIIGRDLVSCDDVVYFMKKAYEAGKAGEAFNVETGELED